MRQHAVYWWLGAMACGALFWSGHAALNQANPNQGAAAITFVVTLLLSSAGLAGLGFHYREGKPFVVGGILGVPLAIILATLVGRIYGPEFPSWKLGLLTFGIIVGISGLVMLLQKITDSAWYETAGASAVMMLLMAGASGLYHLLTVGDRAAEAVEAHDAPGAFLIPLVGLMFLGFVRSRR